MKIFKDENPIDSFLSEFAANITSTGKMPVCEFAKEVLFNGSDKFKLYPTQRAILKSFYNEPLTDEELSILHGWQEEDRTTWVQDRSYIALVLEAGRRASKAVSLNTLIATPEGYKKYGDIHSGDYVFTPKGKPTKVLAETEVFTNKKCYRLYLHTGETLECSADHEWFTWDKSARKAYGRAKNPTKHPSVKTTQEIVDTLYVKRKDGKLENNHSIPLTEPLEYKEQKLLAHPYCLGLYLGDGHYKSGMITSSKEDIHFVRSKFHSLGYDTELVNSSYKYRFKSQRLNRELQELKIYNNKEKLIPNNYLIGSTEQRLELLRGLMDSDGHIDKKGKAYFTNTNFYLSDLVYKLALSLGCVASKTYNTGSYKNQEGEDIICKDYVQVSLRPNLTPVSLPRKAKRYKPCTKQNNKWFIVKAEEIEPIPVKCITVEDKDHLFLIGEELIPTHNCNADFATINTTVGNITYGQLHTRLQAGESIGIQTYDIKTKKAYITYDIKTELNAVEEVFEVITINNKREITNNKHPYYKWYDDTEVCNWVELKQLQPGNNIAVSNYIDVWGKDTLTKEEIKYYAFLLSLSKKQDTFRFKGITRKEVRPFFKLNKKILVSNNYIKLKDICYTDLFKKDRLYNLDKQTTIALLKQLFKFGYSLDSITCGIQLICNNPYKTYIQSLLQKIGVTTKTNLRGIRISTTNSLMNLIEAIGWDFTGDEVLLREYIGKGGFSNAPCLEEQTYKELGHKEIHFEKIKHIRSLGKAQTIALEVKDTHVISNEIVSHNSTMSSIICLKEFYDLITLDEPAGHYGMFPGSAIAILVLAQSKAQVKDTIFASIRGYAENSSYFKNMHKRGDIQILSEEIRCPSKNIAIYAKHTRTEALVGYTIKCLILDEVARFQSVGEDGRNKAFEIWKNVATGGTAFKEHFKKVAISSAWEPGDPIEILYEEGQKDPLTLGFKLTTFQVNLDLVKGVTPSVVSDYTTDYVKARREYEGVRFNKFNSFIDKTRLEKAANSTSCLDATPIPIDIGEGDSVRKYAGVHINRLATPTSLDEISFIHIDPALKKDSAGLAITTPIKVENEDGTNNPKWKIRIDGLVKWEPHTDDKGFKRIVSFLNIEDILNELIDKRNIKRVTFDQWNCLQENTKVWNKINSNWVLTPVRNLSRGDIVLSREGKENKVVSTKKVETVNTIKITTKNNYQLEGTFNHPILNKENNFVELQDLKIGDKVKLHIKETEQVTKNPSNLKEHEALMLGYLIAEGDWGHSGNDIRFTNSEEEVIKDYVKSFTKVVGRAPCIYTKTFKNLKHKDGKSIGCANKKYFQRLTNTLDLQTGAYNKKLPEYVFSATKKEIGLMLSGLFEGDGNVCSFIPSLSYRKQSPRISVELTIVSQQLSKQVQEILLYLGIKSTRRKYNTKTPAGNPTFYYRILIYGQNVIKFKQAVGFRSTRKQNGLDNAISNLRFSRKSRVNHSEDTIVKIERTTSTIIHMEVSDDHTYCSQFINHNSESLIQKLHSKGIDSQTVSCTRDAQFSYYMLFRDLLNHDYIVLPKDSLWTGDLITELSELVLKPNKQIIHPYAAKDMADAAVNAVFQAHQYMIKSGMQMNYGLGAVVAKGGILPGITLTNTDNLKIGSARDKLYKDILK